MVFLIVKPAANHWVCAIEDISLMHPTFVGEEQSSKQGHFSPSFSQNRA
jgi:hypothetical protein